jgi:hypothetical protein
LHQRKRGRGEKYFALIRDENETNVECVTAKNISPSSGMKMKLNLMWRFGEGGNVMYCIVIARRDVDLSRLLLLQPPQKTGQTDNLTFGYGSLFNAFFVVFTLEDAININSRRMNHIWV